MPTSIKSSIADVPKPSSIFYVWYGELCRRVNANPLSIVRPAKPKNEAVLDFVSDRIKAEEWSPILSALRLDTSLHVIAIRSRIQGKFLHDVDTYDKLRAMKRKFGCIWTACVLGNLLKALSSCIKRTQVLSSLELDGLPISPEYLEQLLEALKKNKTIKTLSFTHCPIGDAGCQQLCMSLRFMPNVEVLNVSSCSLTPLSAQYIAKLIRHQQINRYCESWHSSLRYEDPEVGIMAGLKRLTLNSNPNMSDEGLGLILDELDDDLWIKAIDMQRCNITDKMSTRLLDVVDYSKSLEIADFRHNELLSGHTIERIFHILKDKQSVGYEAEFQWCLTTSTLPCSARESYSNTSYLSSNLQKCKSAPLKPTDVSKRFGFSSFPLRRTKTFALLPKKPSQKNCNIELRESSPKKEVRELNAQLENEIAKRLVSERANEELRKQLDKIATFSTLDGDNKVEAYLADCDDEQPLKPKKKLEVILPPVEEKKTTATKPEEPPVQFVFSDSGKVAQNLLQDLLHNEGDASDEENELMYYYDADPELPAVAKDDDAQDDDFSSSNASLFRYVQDMKSVEDSESKESVVMDAAATRQNCGMQESRANTKKALAKVPPIK